MRAARLNRFQGICFGLLSAMLGCCTVAFVSAQGAAQQPTAPAQNWPAPKEGDFVVKDFRFGSGEVLPQMNLHYATLGAPQRDAAGRVTNAVLILHGTGGTGRQFLQPQFAGELFSPGQLLDATRYFIILPDSVGHGRSSKPSDGLRAEFPHYDYDDMIRAQYLLLTEGLGVNHLRLVMGTSMGCMHSFVWGETFPDFMDALMPLACLPVEIAGRNRMWRKMSMDAIRTDPEWQNGDYTTQPRGLRTSLYLLQLVGLAPLQAQKNFPARDQADKSVEDSLRTRLATTDANDFLYQVDASRNYNPAPQLEKIVAPLMHINSADDFINPPELDIAEREIMKVKRGKFVLIPISDETRGHGTHTRARVWKQYLEELLRASEK
ncbi:MAG TPA: alpha/beta fold hydrolase [Candidatus Acidoferrales bacterium]|nr:alpha/beta fold hydrolase [Candidatus Acidoferrales bacterium]